MGGGAGNLGEIAGATPPTGAATPGQTVSGAARPGKTGGGNTAAPMADASPYQQQQQQPVNLSTDPRPAGAPGRSAPTVQDAYQQFQSSAAPQPSPMFGQQPDRGPPGPGGYARPGFGQSDYSAMPPDQRPEQRGFGGFSGGNPFGGGGSPFDMFARMRGMGGGAPDDSNVRDSIDTDNRMMGSPQQMQQRVQDIQRRMQQTAQQGRMTQGQGQMGYSPPATPLTTAQMQPLVSQPMPSGPVAPTPDLSTLSGRIAAGKYQLGDPQPVFTPEQLARQQERQYAGGGLASINPYMRY